MDDHPQLDKKLDIYQEAYKKDANVDISALAAQAIQEEQQNQSAPYMKIYLLSILIPPFAGIYYFFFYFFGLGDTYEDRTIAIIALLLTGVSLFLTIWSANLLFGSFGGSLTTTTPSNVVNQYRAVYYQ